MLSVQRWFGMSLSPLAYAVPRYRLDTMACVSSAPFNLESQLSFGLVVVQKPGHDSLDDPPQALALSYSFESDLLPSARIHAGSMSATFWLQDPVNHMRSPVVRGDKTEREGWSRCSRRITPKELCDVLDKVTSYSRRAFSFRTKWMATYRRMPKPLCER